MCRKVHTSGRARQQETNPDVFCQKRAFPIYNTDRSIWISFRRECYSGGTQSSQKRNRWGVRGDGDFCIEIPRWHICGHLNLNALIWHSPLMRMYRRTPRRKPSQPLHDGWAYNRAMQFISSMTNRYVHYCTTSLPLRDGSESMIHTEGGDLS